MTSRLKTGRSQVRFLAGPPTDGELVIAVDRANLGTTARFQGLESLDAYKALEDFIVDNPDLEHLEDMLAEFNVFEVLGIEKSENRHSAFLAWLLDPNETHGLGDYFLRRFLWRVTTYARAHQVASITPLDVDQWKLRDVTVETERHRIDILVGSQEDRFVCAIENKVFSGEHSNQLKRYRHIVEREFNGVTPLYVLLTVEGGLPASKEDAAYYVPMSYSQISDLTQHVVTARSSSLGVNVQGTLQQYNTSLRRHVLVDSDIQQLARQIYRKHREAIELIIEARPDVQQEVRDIVESIMKDVPELNPDKSSKSFIRYFPAEWDQIPELRKGKGWTETGRMLLFEFRNGRTLSLHLVLGPGPDTVREQVYKLARREKELFTVAGKLMPKWKSLYQKAILSSPDYDEPDFEVIRQKTRQVVSQFKSDDLKRLVRAVQLEFRRA